MKPRSGSDVPGVTVYPSPLVPCFLPQPLSDAVQPLLVLLGVMLKYLLEASGKKGEVIYSLYCCWTKVILIL